MIDLLKENETSIGKKLKEVLPIEWMRYNMFNMEEPYRNIPFLTFRLKKKDETFDELKMAVEEFRGNEEWEIFKDPFSKKGNYILSLSILKQLYEKRAITDDFINEKSYFGELEYKKLCDNALEDIPELLKHIQRSTLLPSSQQGSS